MPSLGYSWESSCIGNPGNFLPGDARRHEDSVLPLERLGDAAPPARGDRLRHDIGKDVLLPTLDASEDFARHRLRRRLRDVEAAVHVRVGRADENSMDRDAAAVQI